MEEAENDSNENMIHEIFEERAPYLLNVDKMIFEMYEEQIETTMDIQEEKSLYSGFGNIDMKQAIEFVDRLFTSKEYQTYIELTRPEQISKRKFEPMSLKKLKMNELEDFSPDPED